MELVRMSKEVKKDGEKKNYTNYYIKLDNGNYIPIKPAFNDDYKLLYVISKEVKNDEKPF